MEDHVNTALETPEQVLQAAREEAEAILAAAKAEAQKTLDAAKKPGKKEPKKSTAGEELVEYTAPLMPWRTDREILVAVNGETIRIKRGVTVRIKRKFLEVLEHAAAQERAAYAYMAAAQQRGTEASAAL